jgi:hypothetical protein
MKYQVLKVMTMIPIMQHFSFCYIGYLLHCRLNSKKQMELFKLFCTYKDERYRVTGASRMGDIWLAKDFNRDVGYDLRVDLDECSGWTPTP